jgi:nitrogen fixation/metabolism regulation signal transduction histidine kinase
MKKDGWIYRVLAFLQRYVSYFVLMCSLVSCCMMLFLNWLMHSMNIEFTRQDIQTAARLTFANVILLCLLCTVVDRGRRYFMVDRPVKKITSAAEKVMNGNLSVRIEKEKSLDLNDSFNIVIDYFNRMDPADGLHFQRISRAENAPDRHAELRHHAPAAWTARGTAH